MKISLLDRSLYYKGLILLIRQDRKIHEEEKKMMLSIGKLLGFDPKFCAKTIDEIMDNPYIFDSPPLFSDARIALCFIRDGLGVSAADGQIHEAEIAWLKSVAEHNGLGNSWTDELEKLSQTSHSLADRRLELSNFEWD
ncbi:MAG: hypothetical protein K4571_04735 [Deltaproteobacteria bacterium]